MLKSENIYNSLSNMLYEENINKKDKDKIKAKYIECLIEFLEIYSLCELGYSTVNIPLVSLYVNSPEFENFECFQIQNESDIYNIIEFEVLNGLPIHRFLNLSEHQFKIFENSYISLLKEKDKYLKENYPCKRCIHFKEDVTDLGYISTCNSEKDDFFHRKEKNINWLNIKECKYCLTYDSNLDEIKKNNFRLYIQIRHKFDDFRKNYLKEKENPKDNYKIKLQDILELKKDLDFYNKKYDNNTDYALINLAEAFKGNRTIEDRKKEIRKALYLKVFLEFFNVYIESEISNNLKIDISKSILFINQMELKHDKESEILKEFEYLLLNGFDICDYTKKENF